VALTSPDKATDRATQTSRAGSQTALLGLLVALFAGAALRLRYLLGASPFVDEYSTVMAVRGVLDGGLPLLPTGFFYGHDLLFTYAATFAALLGGDDLMAVRVMSLAASLGAIALAYVIGQRLFSLAAGLLAAALAALSPDGVLWGARARAYALEQFLALAAFWLFYLGVEQDRPGWRRLGLLLLVAAVFVHPEAALLLPGLALAVLVLHGFRWWLRLDRMVEFGLAGGGVVCRYLLQKVVAGGEVGGFETIADARPTFGFLANLASGLDTVASFLFSAPMIPVTILAGVAILAAALRLHREKRAYATWFLCLGVTAILLQMALVIGGTWQSTRYLIFALPLLFLLAGGGLDALIRALEPRLPRWVLSAVLAGVGFLTLLPSVSPALRAANTSEIAMDQALAYVSEEWAAGDRLATSAPAAAWVHLGQVDYFALGETYEEFVWQKDGRWYDKWVGAPLIRTAEELTAALDEAKAVGATLWFVADESRLLQRYDAGFVQVVWERMALVHAGGRALVFRSRPAPAFALTVDSPRVETFGGWLQLAGYALGSVDQAGSPPNGAVVAEPGQSLPLRLSWQVQAPPTATYTLFVHLMDEAGERWGQVDGPPLGGLYPMHLWQPGILYPDEWRLDLLPDLAPGRYRLEVGLYDPKAGDRLPLTDGPGRLPGDALILDYVTVPGVAERQTPSVALQAEFGGAIRLLGVSPDFARSAVRPGATIEATLHWQVEAPMEQAYTLFVHVVGPDGTPLAQFDGPPQGGFYPTAFWDPGERLEDRVVLVLPADTEPGEYPVVAGFYLLATGERLPVAGADAATAGDAAHLTTLVVEP